MKDARDILNEMRTCRTCKQEKRRSEFWSNSHGGLQTECKPCMRERNTAWGRANADKVRPRNREATNKSRNRRFEQHTLRSIRSRAKKAGLECTITMADLIIPDRCPVLGIKLVKNVGLGRGRGLAVRDRSPSVDRVDNSKGYTPDNIIIVSYRANRLKSDATVAELRRLADFYERHTRRDADRPIEGRVQSEGLRREQDVSLPALLAPEAQEVGQVPIRQG